MAARILLGLAALVTLFFVRTLQPGTAGVAVFLSVWLLLPYAVMAAVLELSARTPVAMADVVTTSLVAVGGLAFLTLVIFIDPDPQGGIAVFFTPVYQGIAMMILFPLSRAAFRKYRHHFRHPSR
jgi:hypothetical protein